MFPKMKRLRKKFVNVDKKMFATNPKAQDNGDRRRLKYAYHTAAFSVMTKDEKVYPYPGTSCHIGLMKLGEWLNGRKDVEKKDNPPIYILDETVQMGQYKSASYGNRGAPEGIMEDKERLARTKRYIEFVTNESMWKLAHFDGNADRILERGAFIVRTKVNRNYMVQACLFNRAIGESNVRLKTWDDMVQKGANPHVALLFMYSHRYNEESNTLIPSIKTSHCPYNGNITIAERIDMLGYLSTDAVKKNTYKDFPGYNSITQATSSLVDSTTMSEELRQLKVAGSLEKNEKAFFPNSHALSMINNPRSSSIPTIDWKTYMRVEEYILSKANMKWKY